MDHDLEPELVVNGMDKQPDPLAVELSEAEKARLLAEWQAIQHPSQPASLAFVEPPQNRPELAFTAISPPDLGRVWPWVRKGLETVLERNLGRASWQPAHIRNAILQNQASLYIVFEGEQPAAFAVITIQNDPFLLVPTVLHVWAEFSATNDWRAANFAHQEIIKLGKRLCLERIEMASTRAAWGRRLASIGMKPAITIYSLDLNEV